MLRFLSTTAVLVGTVLLDAFALNPVEIKGYKFFDAATGENVLVKGIDYYPRPNTGDLDENNLDFFTDEYEHIWTRDLPELKKMGANAIRVYAVDPSKNHDRFMCSLAAHGMYAIIGFASSCEGCAITKDQAPTCYPDSLRTRGEAIINAFAQYDNVLAFSAGNEVNHVAPTGEPEWNAPCQKKFMRDMRHFIGSCRSMRQIPVGVVVADTDRDVVAQYYNCQSDPTDQYEYAEWYGLNTYVHCDGKSKSRSGFDNLQKDFQSYDYSIPVLLTEFGCLNPSFPTVNGFEAQRDFEQVKWLYSEQFRDDFAGGFVFEYSTENANSKGDAPFPFTSYGGQNYGLGYFEPENCDDVDVKCKFVWFPNGKNLAKQYNAVDLSKNQLLKDDFSPESARTKRSTCPKQFPALSTFTWSSDDLESLKCNTKKSIKCKALPGIVKPRPGSSGEEDDIGSTGHVVTPTLLGTLLFCSLAMLFN